MRNLKENINYDNDNDNDNENNKSIKFKWQLMNHDGSIYQEQEVSGNDLNSYMGEKHKLIISISRNIKCKKNITIKFEVSNY